MDDNLLFKICLTLSLLFILILFVISENINLETKDIQNITKKDVDTIIKVTGQVTRISNLPGLIILNLKDQTSEIKVVIFKEEPLNIKQNNFLQIEGKITEYQGELEILAEKIIKI
jgi:RecJ-like exonuclease